MPSIRVKMIMAALLFFCAPALPGPAPAHAGSLEVFVSIPPQACFVERIGQPLVRVNVLVGPGHSPHTYEPTPKQMAGLGGAEIFFRIGEAFERRLVEKIEPLFPGLLVVDTREGVPLLYFDHDSHGHGGHHHGTHADPHIWLDPKRIKIQAATICEALVKARPDHEDLFRENLRRFLEDLDRLDATISNLLAPLEGEAIYVFHPAFGYFADSYGLRQIAIEVDGKEPGARRLADIIQQAREDEVRVIFTQPRYTERYAEAMAREIGAVVASLDPLAPECLENLEHMAKVIRRNLMPDPSAQGNDRGEPPQREP